MWKLDVFQDQGVYRPFDQRDILKNMQGVALGWNLSLLACRVEA